MKCLGRVCTSLLVLITACFAASQEPPTTNLAVGSAVVAEFKGEISLRSPQGEALTLNPGMELPAGTAIQTMKDSSLLLNLQDNSQILVKASSRVVLRSPIEGRGDYLELLIGRILAKIQKRLGNTPSFRMGTPTAVITVRGTRFSVEVNKKQKTFVEVFEGVVEVAGLVPGASPVLLRPGFNTGVDQNRSPESPRQIFGADDRNSFPGRDDNRPGNSNRPGGENEGRSGRDSDQSEHERDHD